MAIIYKNPWGSKAGAGYGVIPQRSDLWTVDFSSALSGINAAFGSQTMMKDTNELPKPTISGVDSYDIQQLSLPATTVNSDAFRRGSIPYVMPTFDNQLDAVRVVFMIDGGDRAVTQMNGSYVLNFIEAWHMLVRAGRQPRGSGYWVRLTQNLTSSFRFPVTLRFLRGSAYQDPATLGADELEPGMELTLENAWVSSYKLSDLTYLSTGLLTLDVTLVCEAVTNTTNS